MRILKNSKANNDTGVSHRGHKARPLNSEGYNSDDEHPTPEESIHTLFVTEEELEEAVCSIVYALLIPCVIYFRNPRIKTLKQVLELEISRWSILNVMAIAYFVP